MEQELEKRGESPGEKWRRKALLLPSSEIPPDFEPIRDQIESEFENRSNHEFGESYNTYDGLVVDRPLNRKHTTPWRGIEVTHQRFRFDPNFHPFKYDETGKYIP